MKKLSHLFIACVVFFLPLFVLPSLAEAQEPLIGEVRMYAGGTIPSGWLLADGSAISRTLYADLYSVITTTYGVGDGSTTFNLPDLSARFPVGANQTVTYTLAVTGGEELHTLTTAEMPEHLHDLFNWFSVTVDIGSAAIVPYYYSQSGQLWGTTRLAGGDEPHNNVPPYLALNFIIYTGYPAPEEPGSEIYLPYVYTHTLESGHELHIPVQASAGQLAVSGLVISLISATGMLLLVEVHHRRRPAGDTD